MELVHGITMRKIWDKWGIALSAACLVHCFAVVFLPLMLPAIELMVHSPWIHRVFALLVIITIPLAFVPGYKRHGVHSVLVTALAGLVLILTGVFLDGATDEYISHGISIVGSFLLVWAHLMNIRHSQKHKHCC